MWRRRRAEEQRAGEKLVADADAEVRAAEARSNAAERLADQSRTVSARLRREIDKNSWTELLLQAMGGR